MHLKTFFKLVSEHLKAKTTSFRTRRRRFPGHIHTKRPFPITLLMGLPNYRVGPIQKVGRNFILVVDGWQLLKMVWIRPFSSAHLKDATCIKSDIHVFNNTSQYHRPLYNPVKHEDVFNVMAHATWITWRICRELWIKTVNQMSLIFCIV